MTSEELQQYRDQLLRDHALDPLYVPRRFTALPESGNLSSDLEFRTYGMLREREPTLEEVLTHPSVVIVADPGGGKSVVGRAAVEHLLTHSDRVIVIGRDELSGRTSVELVHEALIRGWSRLQDWLNEDREFLLWRQRLQTAISNWLRFGKDDGAFLRGALLAEAEGWYEKRIPDLSAQEQLFVSLSREYRDREEQRLKELYAETERAAGAMTRQDRDRSVPRREAGDTTRRLLRIIVASPSDVTAERDALPSIIEELNRAIGRELGIVLQIWRWESDSRPGFHAEGPQGLIDTLLRIEDCDLLIGVFWRRFGTPVGDAASGTEHEFRLAWESWKRNGRPDIMAYFNERAYMPRTKEEVDQWGRVLEFKHAFPKEGLWWAYKGKAHFEQLVRSHLTTWVFSKFGRTAESERV